jgi:hypothetical protein
MHERHAQTPLALLSKGAKKMHTLTIGGNFTQLNCGATEQKLISRSSHNNAAIALVRCQAHHVWHRKSLSGNAVNNTNH